MDNIMLNKIEEGQYKKRPGVRVGDTVKLHLKIKEGSKERIQVFEGVVIAIKGSGINKNLVVRKISYGVGVEKIVPLHTPVLEKIEVVKRGNVRKSKLYYLRNRVGKRALKVGMSEDVYFTDDDEVVVPVEGEAEEQIEADVVEEPQEEEKLEEKVKEEKKKEKEPKEEKKEEVETKE
jgi:large subunit ribosomal protein L19